MLNIDYQRTEAAFIQLGIPDFASHYNQLKQSSFFDLFEKGKMDKDEFIAGIRQLAALSIDSSKIIEAWNAMLLDLPLRRLQLLQQLQLHYNTFLLSNTNVLHEAAFNKILKAQCGFESMAVFFDKIYYSHRIGMRKPDTEIFMLIMEQNDLKPEHILFIDDSPQHIKGAQSLGIRTIWLEKGMTIEEHVFKPK